MKMIRPRQKRYVLSVVNHKGGVGKTTTAVNLAACLGERGSSVLLIDLDPQGSASLALGFADDGERLFQALQKTITLPVEATMVAGVDLVPAGPLLIGAWQRFSGAIGNEIFRQCLRSTEGSWDWIIVDCPPSMGVLTVAALHATNGVLIPVEATSLSVAGLQQMTGTIAGIAGEHRDSHLKVQAIVPCRAHTRRRIHKDVMAQLESAYPGLIAPLVRESAAL
ncbi:MAG: ParA family protein, partial [Nitrospirales bacterium]|nr:ParA family protein [Nitrospirales bacterium]